MVSASTWIMGECGGREMFHCHQHLCFCHLHCRKVVWWSLDAQSN